jgi:hypothetical protein
MIILKKLHQNWMKNKKFANFLPLYVKNGNSYIIMLHIFLKGTFLRNSLKKIQSDEKQALHLQITET